MFKIGIITKAHGTKGEVVITTDSGLEPPVDQVLYLKRMGEFEPVRIQSLRIIEKGDTVSFFVLFKGIADRTSADQLKHLELYSEIEPEIWEDEDYESDVFDCEGYKVQNDEGQLFGYVREIMENPAHPIIVVYDDDLAREFMIPAVDAYIIDINHDDEIITGINLEALTEL
jgi:16S rRNA processing protein RimM